MDRQRPGGLPSSGSRIPPQPQGISTDSKPKDATGFSDLRRKVSESDPSLKLGTQLSPAQRPVVKSLGHYKITRAVKVKAFLHQLKQSTIKGFKAGVNVGYYGSLATLIVGGIVVFPASVVVGTAAGVTTGLVKGCVQAFRRHSSPEAVARARMIHTREDVHKVQQDIALTQKKREALIGRLNVAQASIADSVNMEEQCQRQIANIEQHIKQLDLDCQNLNQDHAQMHFDLSVIEQRKNKLQALYDSYSASYLEYRGYSAAATDMDYRNDMIIEFKDFADKMNAVKPQLEKEEKRLKEKLKTDTRYSDLHEKRESWRHNLGEIKRERQSLVRQLRQLQSIPFLKQNIKVMEQREWDLQSIAQTLQNELARHRAEYESSAGPITDEALSKMPVDDIDRMQLSSKAFLQRESYTSPVANEVTTKKEDVQQAFGRLSQEIDRFNTHFHLWGSPLALHSGDCSGAMCYLSSPPHEPQKPRNLKIRDDIAQLRSQALRFRREVMVRLEKDGLRVYKHTWTEKKKDDFRETVREKDRLLQETHDLPLLLGGAVDYDKVVSHLGDAEKQGMLQQLKNIATLKNAFEQKRTELKMLQTTA